MSLSSLFSLFNMFCDFCCQIHKFMFVLVFLRLCWTVFQHKFVCCASNSIFSSWRFHLWSNVLVLSSVVKDSEEWASGFRSVFSCKHSPVFVSFSQLLENFLGGPSVILGKNQTYPVEASVRWFIVLPANEQGKSTWRMRSPFRPFRSCFEVTHSGR